ncbi:SDR family oxidoreductase [Candidatus Bathyarchaeota archaeon]|nr:SDR family oxidoreductase [Candidatus Bathyarchaeota archaeon]
MDYAVQRIPMEFGRIHVLINNAGIWRGSSFVEMREDWDEVFDVNEKGVFFAHSRGKGYDEAGRRKDSEHRFICRKRRGIGRLGSLLCF